MTVADWEDPQADGFVYRPDPPSPESALCVSRKKRLVGWL